MCFHRGPGGIVDINITWMPYFVNKKFIHNSHNMLKTSLDILFQITKGELYENERIPHRPVDADGGRA